MKLRGRFTLWFCLAALIPIAAAALVTRAIVTDAYREDAEQAQTRIHDELLQVFGGLESEVQARIEGLARREDPYTGGTLLELRTSDGTLPSYSRRSLGERGGPLMKQLSLDLLFLLDHKSVVLNAPHYSPVEGRRLAALATRAKESRGAPYYAVEQILEDGAIRNVLVAEAASELRDGPYSVVVAGGKRVSDRLLAPLRGREGVQLRVVSREGEVLVPALSWSGGDTRRYPLKNAKGEEIARVEMRIANDALPALLEKVSLYTAGLAGAALLLTVLLGILVARSMTRDLEALVDGARAAARGDLDYQVQTRTHDEIGQVGEALNTMMVDLKESKERLVMAERVAAWQEIARRLAHEIKNPLTPIQMSMETLRKTFEKKHPSFDEVLEESTSTVLEEAGRLRRIVSEFSEFARMPKPNKRPLAINDVLRAQLALYRGGSIAIEEALDETLPIIAGDKDSLSQLFLNLLENARDAMAGSDAGRIAVITESHRGGRTVVIHIDDNGPGIRPETRDKLFTPYFTTKHAHGGTGLGLAIAHRIVSDHGGQIVASESAWGGARFTVELPVDSEDDSALLASMSGSMRRAR